MDYILRMERMHDGKKYCYTQSISIRELMS